MSGLISQIANLFRGGEPQQPQESMTETQDEDMQPQYETVVRTVTDYMEIETVEIPLQLQLLPDKNTSRRRQRAAFRAANKSLMGGTDTLSSGQLPRRSRSEGAPVSSERPKHEYFSDADYPNKADITYDYSDLEDEHVQDRGVEGEEQDEPMEARAAPKPRRRSTPKASRKKQPVIQAHEDIDKEEEEEEGEEANLEDEGNEGHSQTEHDDDPAIIERIAHGTATVVELEHFARGKVSVRHHGVPHRKNYELGIVRKYLLRKGILARPEQHGMPYRVVQT
jgi:hypothetical protein